MKPLSSKVSQVEEGIFQVLNEKKNERIKQGGKVYNFSVGTPDFKPAQHIMDAVSEACKKPENFKYALADLPELTDAVIERFDKRYGVTLQPEEITSVYGSQEGMAHIGFCMFDPGDVVLVPNPGYPVFGIGPELMGAKAVTYPLYKENHFLPDFDDIPEARTHKSASTNLSIQDLPLH